MINKIYRRWVCVSSPSGERKCDLIQTYDPARGKLSKGLCQKECANLDSSGRIIFQSEHGPQKNPGVGWTCNITRGVCEQVNGGIYLTKEDCEMNDCYASNGNPLASTLNAVLPTYGWVCDSNSGTCIKVLGGPYVSKEECSSDCVWNGGPSTPSYEKVSHWKWFCSNKGCQYVRTSENYQGFEEYSECASNCAGTSKGDDVIIINLDNLRNMGNPESTGKDSYLLSDIKDGISFRENLTLPEALYTEIQELVNDEGMIDIDFKYIEDLSKFFTTYNYATAIVKKLDFMKYIQDSLESSSTTPLKLCPEDFAAALQKVMKPVYNPNYLSLNIKELHSLWGTLSKHPSMIPIPSKPLPSFDKNGNVIVQGPLDEAPVPSTLLEEPVMVVYRDLNPVTSILKEVTGDFMLENTKMSVELALNKLPVQWRNGLKTISKTRPISSQPFIPESFDNVKGVVPYYGTDKLVSNRVIRGELNNVNINLHQKIDFKVPKDNYAERNLVKYVKYSLDYRTDLNVSANTPQTISSPLNLEYGEKGLILSAEDWPLDVSFKPSNSIVVSVVRKVQPMTTRR